MTFKKYKQLVVKGFTLIELLAVMGIFGLLTTAVVVAYPNTSVRFQVSNIASTLQGDLRQAQLSASSVSSQQQAVAGYGINFPSSARNTYQGFIDKVTTVQVNGLNVGNKKYDGVNEDSGLPVILPDNYEITDVCVSQIAAQKPFSTCRSNNRVQELTILYVRPSAQPTIYIDNNSLASYLASCIQIEYNKGAKGRGFVRNIIITSSGLISISLGGCHGDVISIPLLSATTVSTIDISSIGTGGIGLSADPSGNLYVANSSNNTVTRVTPGDVANMYGYLPSSPSAPVDIGIDTSGTLYVSNSSAGNITYTKFISGSPVTLPDVPPKPVSPTQIAFDGAGGFIYTLDTARDNVWKIDPASGVQTQFGTTGSGPHHVAIDASGNIYTANTNTITKFDSSGVVQWGGPLALSSAPGAITVSPSGNVYVAHPTTDSITMISPSGTPTSGFASTGGDPEDITTDSAGNIYTMNFGSQTISKITQGGVSSVLASTGLSPRAIKVVGTIVYVLNAGSNTLTKVTQ